jgi:hypothetical protein
MAQERPIISCNSGEVPTSGRAGTIAIAAIVLCLACAAAARFVFLMHPWDGDSATFICCGKAMSEGARFGFDVCDNKFPTAALWDGLCWRALGSWWPGYVIAGSLTIAAAIAILVRMAGDFARRSAMLPTLLFALVYINFCPALFGGFQLETFLTFFGVAAAYFAMSGLRSGRVAPAFICGLMSGCSFYLKPTGLSVAAAYGVMELVGVWLPIDGANREGGKRRGFGRFVRQSAALVVGVLIPILAALAYLYATDILGALPRLIRQITGYAQNSVWDGYTTVKILVALLALTVPMFIRKRLGTRETGPSSSTMLAMFATAWLAIEFVGVIAQRRMYGYHFLVLAAPAALLFGRLPARAKFSTLLLPIVPAMFFSMWVVVWQVYGRVDSHTMLVSQYLIDHAKPDDTVWMDYMPRLMMETGLKSASRHLITLPFYNTDQSPKVMGAELLDDLAKHPPTYLIIPTKGREMLEAQCSFMAELKLRPQRKANYCAVWEAIFEFVDRNYEARANVGDRTVYVRRGGSIQVVDIR